MLLEGGIILILDVIYEYVRKCRKFSDIFFKTLLSL